MLLIPYGTDAPVYHMPIATGVTIGINIVVFILQMIFAGESPHFDLTDALAMEFGTFNPLQWFTCVYAHGGVGHLLGNMTFLFIFGIIVEGKIGWWRFLIVYNIIGFAASVIIATVMYGGSGGALGASCAIFGTMAIAMIWAPENEIYMTFATIFFLRPIVFSFKVSVLFLSFLFIALNFFVAFMSAFAMGSEVAHLIGLLPGILIGVGFILFRQVDCDGHDLIAIMRGKRGERIKTVQQEKEDDQLEQLEDERIRTDFENGMQMIERYVNSGHHDVAVKRFEMLKRSNPGMVMPEKWLVKMIRGSAPDGVHNEKSARLMQQYLENYQSLQIPVTLNLARFLIVDQERPRKGIRCLIQIRNSGLDSRQTKTFNALAAHAKKLIADGVIELDD